jgi:hypothetical protein
MHIYWIKIIASNVSRLNCTYQTKNMKLISLILPLFLLLSCTAYKNVSAPKVSESITVNGTKDQLFLKSNEWAIRAFANPQSAIQYNDKNDGKIIGRFLMNSGNDPYYLSDVFSVITITVTDKTAHIEIDPIPWKFSRISLYTSIYKPETAQKDMQKLINSYKTYLELNSSDAESIVSR